jgi:hypothetical protein
MEKLEKGLLVGGFLGLAMSISLGMGGDSGKIRNGQYWSWIPAGIIVAGALRYAAKEFEQINIQKRNNWSMTMNRRVQRMKILVDGKYKKPIVSAILAGGFLALSAQAQDGPYQTARIDYMSQKLCTIPSRISLDRKMHELESGEK